MIDPGPAAMVTAFTHTEYTVNLSKFEMRADNDETLKDIFFGGDMVSDALR